MTLLDRYKNLVAKFNWSERLVVWSFLASVSAVLQRKCFMDEGGFGYLYPNLYVLLVGPPASRKTTTARFPLRSFLKQMENPPMLSSNQLTQPTLVEELKESEAKNVAHEMTPLFVFAGEFGVFINDLGAGSLVDLLLEFFDERSPGELWQRNIKKYGRQEVRNPAVTLLACTTPAHIQSSQLAGTAGLGFTSRFIIVNETKFIEGTSNFKDLRVDPKELIAIRHEFDRMNNIVGVFDMADDAHQELNRILEKTNHWCKTHPGSGLMEHYMTRKPVQIRKVAMIFSAMRDNRKIVTKQDMLNAEEVIEMAEEDFLKAFGVHITYRDEALVTKILNKVPNDYYITQAQLLQAFILDGQAVPDGTEFHDAMRGLIHAQVISVKIDKDNNTCYRQEGIL